MPATSESNLGGGEKKVVSFRKNHHYLFPNLQHTQFKHIQLAVTLTQSLWATAETRSEHNHLFQHWTKASYKNTTLLPPTFLKYDILFPTSAAMQEFLGNFRA